MERLIDFRAPEVQTALSVLLQDKSTKRNIIWATDPPEALRDVDDDKSEITIPQLQQMGYEAILPRMMKRADTQQERTRKKGEVFSPAWVCNKMNNALDADWFGPDLSRNAWILKKWRIRKKRLVVLIILQKSTILDICNSAPKARFRRSACTKPHRPIQKQSFMRCNKAGRTSAKAGALPAFCVWALKLPKTKPLTVPIVELPQN